MWQNIASTDVSGLGGAALLAVGSTTGTVAAGNDSRFANGSGLTGLALASSFTGADAGAKIANALAALPGTGGTVIADVTGTITTHVDITTPNTTVLIPPWVTLTKGGNTAMLRVMATNSGVAGGGTIDGNTASFTGDCVQINTGGDKGFVRGTGGARLTVKNGRSKGVEITGASDALVENCIVTGNGVSGIFAEISAPRTTIRNNYVTSAGTGPPIGGNCNTLGTGGLDHLHVLDNYLEINGSTAAIFGIEVASPTPSTGVATVGVVIRGNTVVQTGSSTVFGGYSFPRANGMRIEGNSYHTNGLTTASYGIEIPYATGVVCRGNTINGGTDVSAGIEVNTSSRCIIEGNLINGFVLSNSTGGITVYADSVLLASQGFSDSLDNHVHGNTIIFPGATGTLGNGILVQCNASTSHVDRTMIMQNKVVGNASGGNAKGIKLDAPSGTVDKTFHDGNFLYDVTTPVFGSNDTNTTAGTNAT